MPTPGVVHDPLSPLVLGDSATGVYCVQTFNQLNKKWTLQVVDTAGGHTSTLSMDPLGNLLINGTDIGSLPSIAAAVAAAQAAANSAVAASTNAINAATIAGSSADAALLSADQADNSAVQSANSATAAQQSAQLSADFAQAPATTTLPGGGVSSKVSADNAALSAVSTRDMPLLTSVSGNQTYSATWLYARKPFTGTALQTLTVPANVFQSPSAKTAFGIIQNRGAGGSIKIVGAAGALNLLPATIKGGGSFAFHYKGLATRNFFADMAVPAITSGKLVLAITSGFEAAGASTMSLSFTQSVTATALKALVNPIPVAYEPNQTVWEADLTAFTAKTVRVTVSLAVQVGWTALSWWAIENPGGFAGVPYNNIAAAPNNISSVTTPSLGNQTLILGQAVQRGTIAQTVFSSFGGGLTLIDSGNSAGADDASVPDTANTRNFGYARGSMLTPSAGVVTPSAQFSTVINSPALSLIAYAPATSIGSGAVVMHYENNTDTLSQANGEAELTFEPDGLNVWVKMSQ